MSDVALPQGQAAAGEIKGRSLWVDAWRRLIGNRAAVVSMIVLGIIVVLAVLAPWLSPFPYDEVYWDFISAPPGFDSGHIFGTDQNGRDLFVRTLYGGRVSLTVGVVATMVSLVIGVAWGATAGVIGGPGDAVGMRIVRIPHALPLLLVILLTVVCGRYIVLIYVAIGAISWLDMARIVRGQAISLKRREFVEGAIAGGVSTLNIVRRHIIPNTLGPVVVYVTLTVPSVIL